MSATPRYSGQSVQALAQLIQGEHFDGLATALNDRGITWEQIAFDARTKAKEADVDLESPESVQALALFVSGYIHGFAAGHNE